MDDHEIRDLDIHNMTLTLLVCEDSPGTHRLGYAWYLQKIKASAVKLVLLMEEILHQLRLVVFPVVYRVFRWYEPPNILATTYNEPTKHARHPGPLKLRFGMTGTPQNVHIKHLLKTQEEKTPGCLPGKHYKAGPLRLLSMELFHPTYTWRIIPVSKWFITMVNKSPSWGYSLSKWPQQFIINGGDPNYLVTSTGMILQVAGDFWPTL